MFTKRLSFKNESGFVLAARLDMPDKEKPIAYALFSHCFTCSKDHKAAVFVSESLTRERIAVMRFDFTGLGDSEGDFTETNFSSNVVDLIAAATFLQNDFAAPKLLIGHSLGGAAVIKAAGMIPSSKAVATIATPFSPSHVMTHFDYEKVLAEGIAEVTLLGNTVEITKQFVEDVSKTDIEKDIRNLNRALLVMHAPGDRIVGIEHASRIFQTARHPKSFVSLDDADHLLSSKTDAFYVGGIIAAWSKKYL